MLGLQYSDSDSESEQESTTKIKSSIPNQTLFTRPNIIEKSLRYNPLSSTGLRDVSQRVSTAALANDAKNTTCLHSETYDESQDDDGEDSTTVDIAALITKARLLSGRGDGADLTSPITSARASTLPGQSSTESTLLPVTTSTSGKGSTSMFMNYMKQLQASEQEQTPDTLKQQHEHVEMAQTSFAFSALPNDSNDSFRDTAANHNVAEDTTTSPYNSETIIDYRSLYSHIGASTQTSDRSSSLQNILPSKSKGRFPQNVKVVDIDVNAMRALSADEQQAMILDQAAKAMVGNSLTLRAKIWDAEQGGEVEVTDKTKKASRKRAHHITQLAEQAILAQQQAALKTAQSRLRSVPPPSHDAKRPKY